MAEGVERISSKDLSARMHVTASQIRQDLNNFGGFGQQGYGYNVQYLRGEIGKLLGLDRQKHVIIIGAGHLGQALANYANFSRRGFEVKALFDVDPAIIGKTIRSAQVYSLDYLETYLAENEVDIATLTLPRAHALEVINRLCSGGVKAIFSPIFSLRRFSAAPKEFFALTTSGYSPRARTTPVKRRVVLSKRSSLSGGASSPFTEMSTSPLPTSGT